jgi:ATP-dependent protease ClpP protease subunit
MNKPNTLHFFNSATAEDVLTLNIMDAIGADFFGGGITARQVSDAISQAEHFESITLSINSPGGDLFEGVAIHNVLKASGKPVNVEIIGLAASAASLIAMAGGNIVAMPGSVMMIHEAMAFCQGYSADMTKMAAVLDTVTSSAADLYVAKTKLSKTKVMALMAEETWMEPKEAVEMGFATEVGSNKKAKAAATNSFDLSVFRNVPDELKPKKEGEPFPPAPAPAPAPEPEPGSPGSPVVNPVVVNTNSAAIKVEAVVVDDPLIEIFRKRLEMLRA